MKYRLIDLFTDAGGLPEDFIRTDREPIVHIKVDHYACDSLKTHAAFHYLKESGKLEIYEEYLENKEEKTDGSWLWNQVLKSAIDSVIQEAIGKETLPSPFEKIDKLRDGKPVDMIIGGPLCQAYSIADHAKLGKKIEEGPHNDLYKFYVESLKRYKPKMFVLENVLGTFTAKGGGPFRDLIRLARELDYSIDLRKQVASQRGVLQKRHRITIVGW